MRTIDLKVGKKYMIHNLEIEIIRNDFAFMGIVLSGENKGKYITGLHTGYCKPNNIGTECVIHKNNGCVNIIEL